MLKFDLHKAETNLPQLRYLDESTIHASQCSENPMERQSYKEAHKLFYPVNVGRNAARDAAPTYFIFASDIELYPSPGVIPRFLTMIADEPTKKVWRHTLFYYYFLGCVNI